MVDLTKMTDDQWTTAAEVLRGAAAQADEYSAVVRQHGHEGDPMGFAAQAAGLRRLARFCEDDRGTSDG